MLKLYQSNRVEYLVDLLADVMSRPLQDPFSPETIVVQHPAMGRWLSLRLADRLGVCANTRFPLPAGFVWSMFRLLMEDVPERNRFAPAVMQWRIFELLDELRTEKAFAPVGAYLRSVDRVGSYELAGRIADCFDRYLVYRPDWIQRWEKGQSAAEGDAWQAELWRRLVHPLGSDHWRDSWDDSLIRMGVYDVEFEGNASVRYIHSVGGFPGDPEPVVRLDGYPPVSFQPLRAALD